MFVGDDWPQDHRDVEVQDESGRRVGKARLPEGVAGVARLHELITGFTDHDQGPEQALVGIETDRGPWVSALVAAGYRVFAVNPRQVARYENATAVRGPRATSATHTRWPTWSAPTPTNCARSPGTPQRRKGSS